MLRLWTLLILLLLSGERALADDPITIYLAGDSTMARKLPEKRPETGWGEALQKYFREDRVRVENHAQNGRSTRTFIAEQRWQAIVDKLKSGDYVFIQFGHNDESKEKVDRYTPPADFRRNLIGFVNDVRSKHATPVLFTPVMRRRFDKDRNFFDTHGEYPDIVRAVAAEQKVLLIDMHRASEGVIKNYGVERSRRLFLQLAPNENPNYPNGIEDNTHFSPRGADVMARLVVDAMQQQKFALAKRFNKEAIALPTTVVWDFNHLDKIGNFPVTKIGDPKVISLSPQKAVVFDGIDDGLVIASNPISGAEAFTVEAIFRPDSNGPAEQRWLHIQEEAQDNRVLLETRVAGNEWFLDTFIKSGNDRLTLYSENHKHPTDAWYHVALVFDGATMRHFVNGIEELSGPLIIEPLGKGATSIGVRMNRVHWFKGAVRTARFTPRALTVAEFLKTK